MSNRALTYAVHFLIFSFCTLTDNNQQPNTARWVLTKVKFKLYFLCKTVFITICKIIIQS